MLTDDELIKFNILIKTSMGIDQQMIDCNGNIFALLYKNEKSIVCVFSYLHEKINLLFEELQDRVDRRQNRYLIVDIRNRASYYLEDINQLKSFFHKNNYDFECNQSYINLLTYIVNKSKEFGRNAYFEDGYVLPQTIIDEPIFCVEKKTAFKNISYLYFGADNKKPDIVVKDVLDSKLEIINDNEILVYDGSISDSLLYKDFKQWWSVVSTTKYKNYKTSLNYMEQKVADFYKNSYKQRDDLPVLIPQVYLHYDPKDQKLRKKLLSGKILTFQRMDFLIIYKGKRVILEIDGSTHTPQNSLEYYSKQCEYDRNMKFLGYDVFRLGGHELTYNFDNILSDFFNKLFDYLEIKI